MQRPSTLIFLSLFTALCAGCGRNDISPPEPIAFKKGSKASEAKSSKHREPNLNILEAVDVASAYPVEVLDFFELWNRHFFKQFKAQYQSGVLGIEVLPQKNHWYLPPSHYGDTRMSFSLSKFKNLKYIEFTLSSFEEGSLAKKWRYNGPFGIRLDLQISIPKTSGITVISVSDFKFKGEKSFKEKLTAQEQNTYKIHVEAKNERIVLEEPVGESILDALRERSLDLRLDSEGGISRLLDLDSANTHVDINSYGDSVGFWKVANTPGQELRHRPSGGQEVLIKYVSMEQMRKYVAKKTQKRVHFKGRVFEHIPSPQTDFWGLKNIQVKKVVPTAKSDKLPGKSWAAYMMGIRRPKNYCHFIRHSVFYKTSEPFSMEDVKNLGDKVILQSLSKKSLSLQVGDQNGNCDPKNTMYNKKKLDFLYQARAFPVKYEVSADLVETGRL